MSRAPLPIDDILPQLLATLARSGKAVLQAPPGAGKTTRVPLAMLEAGLVRGRILLLEPRRLAARAAAARMAETLGQPPGQTVGYRIRGESKVSGATRIEVVTEGILTRMIQADPGLEGVGAVIFDEFHERSLHADLELALVLEARAALRDDLALLVMSATLDAAPVAELIGAPILTSEGRAFPVETRWLPKPLLSGPAGPGGPGRNPRTLGQAVAPAVLEALAEGTGGLLVFLPGEAEIRACQAALDGRLPTDVRAFALYGNLPPAAQAAALAPLEGARKLVLATAIAETSLTIDGIRGVVDAGLARRARFDPGSGMSRLVTERVSRAEAEQRRGRAGRVAPGICWRLWTRGEEGALPAHAPAEIEVADLAPLALELALWGSSDLAFLTAPPAAALAEAQALLADLGALAQGRITDHGKALAGLPLHPRLAHMLLRAGLGAAPLAALLEERDPLRGAGADLALRLALLADPGRFAKDQALPFDRAQVERIRSESRRLAALIHVGAPAESRKAAPGVSAQEAVLAPGRGADGAAGRPARSGDGGKREAGEGSATADILRFSPAQMAALAYPDRIALRRKGDEPRYLLSGGKGAVLDAGDALAGQRLLVVTDTDGGAREARIRQAAALTEAELRAVLGRQVTRFDLVEWSRREGKVIARRQERLGALVLEDRIWTDAPAEALAGAALEGLRQSGLSWSDAARRLAARIALVQDLADVSEPALLEGDVLLPWLQGRTTSQALKALDLVPVLQGLLGWDGQQRLEIEAPAAFETPLGRRIPIDYGGEAPEITLRLQELFGTTRHPVVGGRPLRVTLLSPGGKPVQTTTDIPGFWASSYADVRKDMRGRYPRHPWPEDPTEAAPTLRAKPRGT